MDSYRSSTVKALGWAFASQITTQIVSFIYGIVLARLLVPDDFGLLAMSMVFVGLANLITEIGLGASLIHKKDIREEHLNSVFWVNLLLGFCMSAALYMSSSWLAGFYGRTEIENIIKILSISFIIGSLSSVPRTRLMKELKYKHQSIADFIGIFASGVIAIFLALNGFQYWALVAHVLIRQTISTVLIWIIGGWHPGAGIDLKALRELIGFSSGIFGSNILRYLATNMDKLLLGKYLGGETLGVYDKAYSIMLFPLQNISRVVGGVMFPSLSLIQEDRQRVRFVYLRTVRSIAFITFPMMMGMFVVADSFTLGILGPHWIEMIPVMKVFCVAGIVTSISTITGSLFKSQGASVLEFKMTIVTVAIRLAGIVLGLRWGAFGVAVGFTASMYINAVIGLAVAGKLVDLSVYDVAHKVAPSLIPASIMALLVWCVRPVADLHNESLIFLAQVAAGIPIYILCVHLMKLDVYKDILKILNEDFRKK